MMNPSKQYLSWGRTQRYKHSSHQLNWLSDLEADFARMGVPILAFGKGRSYGDCCLNDAGLLLDTSGLRRFIHFDEDTGRLTCEAGVTIAEIIRVFLPRGWFPPVVPGTKNVTVGGAIANDIHGKNHHVAGTFGRYVHRFALTRSDKELLICSPNENSELFAATIGGMGLTGVISWAEIQLKPVTSARIDFENIKFNNLDDFFELSRDSARDFEYTVAWIDSTAPAQHLGRGIFMRGNHTEVAQEDLRRFTVDSRDAWSLPVAPPFNLMQGWVVRALNSAYFHKQVAVTKKGRQLYESYFFPLDKLDNWNLTFGNKGFYQYQFVVDEQGRDALKQVLALVRTFPIGSFVTVLKAFGSLSSPGMMSFPKEGYTLTLDFPNLGAKTQRLFERFEEIIGPAGGRVYAAKDAVSSAKFFREGYERFGQFTSLVDPKFSSNLWRRVSHGS